MSGDIVGGPSRCAAVADGTDALTAKGVGSQWQATRLDLTLVTFDPVCGRTP